MKTSKAMILGLFASFGSLAWAETYTWSGNAEGAWNDAANWLVGGEAAATYPGETAEDDTVLFPSGSFTVTGEGTESTATTFKISKFTCTAGDDADHKNAVTFKNIRLYWTSAPVPASNLRLTFDNVQYGCLATNSSRISFSGKTNCEIVLIGDVVSNGTGAESPLSWMGSKPVDWMITGGGKAAVQIYQPLNENCTYTIDGGIFGPKGSMPTAGHFIYKNGGQFMPAASLNLSGTVVNDITLTEDDLARAGCIVSTGNLSLNLTGDITFNFDLADAPLGTYVIAKHTPSKTTNAFNVPDATAENLGFALNLLNAEGKKAHLELVQTKRNTLTDSVIRLVVESAGLIENAWITEPSLTITSWWAGSEEAALLALDSGSALDGEVSCNYTADELRALPAGRYLVRFEVPGTEKRTELVKTFEVVVKGEDVGPATYTWKSSVTEGVWSDPANWETEDGLAGFPSNVLVRAVIPGGERIIDLEGCTIPLHLSVSDPGLTVNGDGVTLRNGGIIVGRLWGPNNSSTTYENFTVDLSSSALTAYYKLQKSATAVLRGTVRVLQGLMQANGWNDDLTVCDGSLWVAGDFAFGCAVTDTAATKGTLEIRHATLTSGRDISLGTSGLDTHKPSVVSLTDGSIACTNDYMKSGAYVYGKLKMPSPIVCKLNLAADDKREARMMANTATLNNLAVVVTSIEETGIYPLVSARSSLTFADGASLADCTIDCSALGKGWVGSFKLSDDGKTLLIKVTQKGLTLLVR